MYGVYKIFVQQDVNWVLIMIGLDLMGARKIFWYPRAVKYKFRDDVAEYEYKVYIYIYLLDHFTKNGFNHEQQ